MIHATKSNFISCIHWFINHFTLYANEKSIKFWILLPVVRNNTKCLNWKLWQNSDFISIDKSWVLQKHFYTHYFWFYVWVLRKCLWFITDQKCFSLKDLDAMLFHTPYCKLVQKSLGRIAFNDFKRDPQPDMLEEYQGLETFRYYKLVVFLISFLSFIFHCKNILKI